MSWLSTGVELLNLYNAYKSYDDAQDQADAIEDNAEKRADNLRKYANLEYSLNSSELKRAYYTNMSETYRESAAARYKIFKTFETEKSKANVSGANGFIVSSSFRNDAIEEVEMDQQMQLQSNAYDLSFNLNELSLEYSAARLQLSIDRDKMMDDISLSVDVAESEASVIEKKGTANALGYLSDALVTAYEWDREDEDNG